MKTALPAIAFCLAMAPALAADDMSIQRMATCQDSWLEWQTSDPAKLQKFGDDFRAAFAPHGDDAFVVPKVNKSIAGLHISQAFPVSVGMGVGFSLTVDAPFDKTRTAMEKTLGKPLGKCDTSDGMRTCELDIAEKKTFVLMSGDDPKSPKTLLGCYYYYEK